MGIFTDIKDSLKIAMVRGNDGCFKIEKLSKLNESQLKKLIDKNENFRININYYTINIKDYKAIYNLIKFYNTADFHKVKEIIYFMNPETLTNVLKNSDTANIKENIQQEYLNDFLIRKEKIDLNKLEPEFIEKNKDKLLSEKLSSDLLTKFYKKELIDDDIFNNIEIFSNIELFNTYNIANFVASENMKLLLSKITLQELKEILELQKERFIKNYKNNLTKVISILKEENIDTVKELTNLLYEMHFYVSDSCANEYINSILTTIGKKKLLTFLKENMLPEYYDDNNKIQNFLYRFYRNFINYGINISEFATTDFLNYIKKMIVKEEVDQRKILAYNTNNKEYFLPENAPEELKEKFYSETMTYEDLLNNMEYFKETNMSLGFRLGALTGAFENDAFLEFLKKINGNFQDLPEIESTSVNRFLLDEKLSYEKYIALINNYYENKALTYATLQRFNNIGIMPNNVNYEEIERNIKNANFINVLLNAGAGPDIRLFTDNVVKNFGYGIIRTLSEYNTHKSMLLFVKYTQNENDTKILRNWFIYLDKNNILNKRTVMISILNYANCIKLIENLLTANINLNNEQKNALISIIDNGNIYNVQNLEQLTNYTEHKKGELDKDFNSNNLQNVQEAICKILFDTSIFQADEIFKNYLIQEEEFFKYNFIDTGLIEPNLLASITIIKEIKNFQGTPEELREKYQEIIKVGKVYSKQEIILQLSKMYSDLWNKELYKPDEKKQGKASSIKGVDRNTCKQDVFGKPITSNDDIDIIELDGEPFKLIVHSISDSPNGDDSMASIPKQLLDDPSIWNRTDGSTALCTSLISDKHIATFTKVGSVPYHEIGVFYGFNSIPSATVIDYNRGDNSTQHGGGEIL